MKYLLIIPFLFLLISCTPEKRIQRILRHHPELLISDTLTIRDTVIVPTIKADTSFILSNSIDTFYLEKERLKIKIIKDHDTLKVEGACVGDTVYIEKKVPYDKVVIKPQSFADKYGEFFMILIVLGVIYWSVRKFGK